MADQTTSEAARTEIVVQVITLVFGLAGCVLFVLVQRKAADPDWERTRRMRMAKSEERGFARLAGWAWRKAERARLAYEREAGP